MRQGEVRGFCADHGTPGDEIQFLKRKMVLHHYGRLSIQTHYKLSSWSTWYRGTLVSLTDCQWWFDSPLVRQ